MSRIKKIKKSFKIAGRTFTSFARALPDYIIIGAQKSGTTSLYNYLIQHPSVVRAFKKEIHYFDSRYRRGNYWYRAFFPYKKKISGKKITGEASPSYLFYPRAAARIFKTVPDAKLIVLLRDPVDRAISSYIHQWRSGRETQPVLKALKSEEERLSYASKKIKKSFFRKKKYTRIFRKFAYKKRGHYAKQLKEYLKYFERDKILIEFSENFFNDISSSLKDIYRFLSIDKNFTIKEPKVYNSTNYAKNPDIPEEAYLYLKEYFRPLNRELKELLDRNIPWEY